MTLNLKPVRPQTLALCMAAAGLLAAPGAGAIELETGNPALKARWDNTVKYSTAFRLKNPAAELVADPNLDDGDRNFRKGLISNRLDLLSELDVVHSNGFGVRISGSAWYDAVYNRGNDNDSPFTANAASVPFNQFTHTTRRLHGRKAELLDAFVFGRFELAGRPLTARLGKHTLLYGESLFFGNNGIAGAQAPVDVIKALSVPGSQVKEILRPVNQASIQAQVSDTVSMGAYVQFDWKPYRLPAAGSYFAPLDMGGPGAERFLLGAPPAPGLPPPAFLHAGSVEARNSGQFGGQLRFKPRGSDVEYGLYALQFHAKTPALYIYPDAPGSFDLATGRVGQIREVYAENIRLFGASFSTTLADVGVAGELSTRRNTPLASTGALWLGSGDNRDNPLYATGNSVHGQVSALHALPRTALWHAAQVVAEVAFNHVTDIRRNAGQVEPLADRTAWGLRVLLEPSYYQVVEGLDISVPINLGYAPKGRSMVAGLGPHRGGDLTIGVNGEYLKAWKFGVSWTHYFGPIGPMLDGAQNYTSTFRQAMRDRDFVSLTVQRTF